MVKHMNVSRYNGTPPQTQEANRKITGGPIYSANEVLALLAATDAKVIAWTRDCSNDLQKYGLDMDDAKNLLRLSLQSRQFLGSEWCLQKTCGPWAACDSYRVFVRQWVKAAHKDMDFEYYLKFAIGKTGNIILLVSCHLSTL